VTETFRPVEENSGDMRPHREMGPVRYIQMATGRLMCGDGMDHAPKSTCRHELQLPPEYSLRKYADKHHSPCMDRENDGSEPKRYEQQFCHVLIEIS
jgi:hypothetical protein